MSLLSSLFAQYMRARRPRALQRREQCPVCGASCAAYDTVDFNKSCEESRGKFLAPSNIPITYYQCASCEFCFAPEIARWSLSEFQERIYNKDYVSVDPDYAEARPRANAEFLRGMFGEHGSSIRHLDYGGGNARLSQVLNQEGWNSNSYDPFVDRNAWTGNMGQFDLVTAFEVFEHVPDPRKLVRDIAGMLAPDGIVLFSTLLSDGLLGPNQRLTWWYASPRNGHISLFSSRSLTELATENEFRWGNLGDGLHAMWRSIPAWAAHILPA